MMKTKLRSITAILIMVCSIYAPAKAQVDLKNSLPELLKQFDKAKGDQYKANVSLAISNFYLNNKSFRSHLDTALYYADRAQQLSKAGNYTKGQDDAAVLRARVWAMQNKLVLIKEAVKRASGGLKSRLLISLANFYMDKNGSDPADLKIAETYYNAAANVAREQRMPTLALSADIYLYKLFTETYRDSAIIAQKMNYILAAAKQLNKPEMAGRFWMERSNYFYSVDERERYLQQALKILVTSKDTASAIWVRKELADIDLQKGKLDMAEQQLLDVLRQYRKAGYRNLQFTYNLLTAVYIKKTQLQRAMSYGVAAINCADSTGTDKSLDFFYYGLGNICNELNLHEEAFKYYKKCIDVTPEGSDFPYGLYRVVITDQINKGQIKNILPEFKRTMKKYPPKPDDQLFIQTIYGEYYAVIKQIPIAERYWDRVADKVRVMNKDYMYYQWCQWVTAFYINNNLYKKGEYFLNELFHAPPGFHSGSVLSVMYQFQSKIDISKGDYASAVKHTNKSRAISDSLSNRVRLKQAQELQIQFKTAQKERENLVLRNRNIIQQTDLEKELLEKKLYGTGLLATFLILGLVLFLYRAKQRSNESLKTQQNEINSQNLQLNQLLGEKEWLIKEIHHRVKNNLQIISSLLNTQSSYLDNEEAKTAIRDSQNRMQAISIVHQKLYQSNDLATVEFKVYLEELVQSICDSFQSKLNVQFEFNVIKAYLSTAESVPIGLILNEAITNSIKYAFKDTLQPRITITMDMAANGMYRLMISDNGKGLPADFDIDNCSSLGINLMVGLTEQLSGTFSIDSDNGTTLTMVFPPFAQGVN